jgi:hypothetical protein
LAAIVCVCRAPTSTGPLSPLQLITFLEPPQIPERLRYIQDVRDIQSLLERADEFLQVLYAHEDHAKLRALIPRLETLRIALASQQTPANEGHHLREHRE